MLKGMIRGDRKEDYGKQVKM